MLNESEKILVVDDKEPMREVLRKFLAAEGYEVIAAANAKDALAKIARSSFDLVLSDIKMPGMDGNELLEQVLTSNRKILVILMTAFGSIEAAVAAVRRGAVDYISKPFEMDEVLLRIRRALKERDLERRVLDLEQKIELAAAPRQIIGNSASVKRLRQIIERVAPLDDTILIAGETGTGKELVARALHYLSRRNAQPFVALDCSSIPETLIESELFGHEKGSFTNAVEARIGLLETARSGTLFLDEVETLSLTVQAKLLRVLQERVFRRVGGRSDLQLKARILAATNQDLAALVETGSFRRDLFYRLNVIPVQVPALRERPEDIPELTTSLLARRARELGVDKFRITSAALQVLTKHEWRGNVRELENVLLYATALGGAEIDAADLPDQLQSVKTDQTVDINHQKTLTLAQIEKQHILNILAASGGNRVNAARILGVDRRTLYNKLRQYDSSENVD